jgi:2-amino-4-hydroxy-6-hydroxymethyldihydropteridine diphosphokinase
VHELAYLSLGANVGDRAANLHAAIDRLRVLGEVVAVSSFYETEPVEFTAQPWFLNCAVKLNTEKTPQQFLAGILEIEQQLGRRRGQQKGLASSTSTFCCSAT